MFQATGGEAFSPEVPIPELPQGAPAAPGGGGAEGTAAEQAQPQEASIFGGGGGKMIPLLIVAGLGLAILAQKKGRGR